MTPDPNSADLEQLKSLLAKSFQDEQGDDVPPLPDGLRDRLKGQYGRVAKQEASFWAKFKEAYSRLAKAFAKPAYAGATLAVLVALIAVVFVKQPKQDVTFRGNMEQAVSASIILYQVNEVIESAIRDSGYFEASSLRVIRSPEDLAKVSPPAVIINGETGELVTKSEGQDSSTALPADSTELADLIVKLLQEL